MLGAGLLLWLASAVAGDSADIETFWHGGIQGKFCLDFPKDMHGWGARLVFDRPVDQLDVYVLSPRKEGDGRVWTLHSKSYNNNVHAGDHICAYFVGYLNGNYKPNVKVVADGSGSSPSTSQALPTSTTTSAISAPPTSASSKSSANLTASHPSVKATTPLSEAVPDIKGISGAPNVIPGDNVTLLCHVTGSPPPSVTWSFLSSTGLSVNKGSGPSYNITNMDASKTGVYVCQAVNSAGNTSAGTLVHFTDTAPTVKQSSNNVTLHARDNVTLTCDVRAFPEPNFTWQLFDAAGEVSVVGTGQKLFLSSVDPSKQGRYVCLATNSLGNASVSYDVVLHEEPPVIRNITPHQRLHPGDNVTLSCDVTGVPTPLVTWRLLQSNGHVATLGTGPTYDVISADAKKAGLYFCYASNSLGVTSASVTVEIQDVAPSISNVPSQLSVNYGASLTLTCDVTAVPPASVTWERIITSGGRTAVARGSVLYVPSVGGSHEGVYVCTASNRAGNASAAVHVTIQRQAPKIAGSPGTLILPPGASRVLTCNATGFPSPAVSWSFISHNGDVHPLETGPSHNVINMDASQEGFYICKARNGAGETSALVAIKLQDVSPTIVQGPSDVTGRPGDNVTLTCRATGFPSPSLAWGHYDMFNFPEPLSRVPDVSVDTNGDLHVTSLSNHNAGRYVCRAVNRAGLDTATVAVILDTNTSP